MSTDKTAPITAALEDYLEAIFNLCRFDKAARSRDIAESLNVHKSTVTAALKSLGNMRLINYAPYEAVTLTPEGRKVAEDVARRHAALKNFFIDVLHVEGDTAESAACGMEHAIPREIVDKLADFAESMRGCPRIAEETADRETDDACCAACGQKAKRTASARTKAAETAPDAPPETLDSIPPGRTVTVVSVKGGGELKKRLAEMGVVRGALATVERIAPMGDPMDLKIKGYHLSLRKEEAAKVVIKG